ncbi:hypothetical protein [Actinotignum urinale]|uniref:hypothetical protein n=1 Tax=Actinotignum urinale TaxID=190146 RepID=UPI0003B6E79C|nr:hypothetical protein [Actinotignum urinale]MDY5159533.1 hypothetical protein [Actinotignum urinale]
MKNSFAILLLLYAGWNIFYTATKHTTPAWLSIGAGAIWITCALATTYMLLKPKEKENHE